MENKTWNIQSINVSTDIKEIKMTVIQNNVKYSSRNLKLCKVTIKCIFIKKVREGKGSWVNRNKIRSV